MPDTYAESYRQMAEDAVDVVLASVPSIARRPRCRTRRLPIRGSGAPPIAAALGVAADIADHLVGRFGSEALGVATGCRATPGGTEPLVPGLSYLRGEALHAVRNEMACSLADVLSRRTRAAILDRDATLATASDVAGLIATDLGWSRSRQLDETASFAEALARATASGPTVGGSV
jgi:glycerol-3-phosphate dehydrogenase